MRVHIVRHKCSHPIFECLTLCLVIAQITLQSLHNTPQGLQRSKPLRESRSVCIGSVAEITAQITLPSPHGQNCPLAKAIQRVGFRVQRERVPASSSCREAGATPLCFHFRDQRASMRMLITSQYRLLRPNWHLLTAILSRFYPTLGLTNHSPRVTAAMKTVARPWRDNIAVTTAP